MQNISEDNLCHQSAIQANEPFHIDIMYCLQWTADKNVKQLRICK